jgi:hypothetical protein
LLAIADTTRGEPSVAFEIGDGHAEGASISDNVISGFRYAFRVKDGGQVEENFTSVDVVIEGNSVTDCYAGLVTEFDTSLPLDTLRRISYKNNIHRRMERYVVELSEYSQGTDISDNTLDGHYVNTAVDTDVGFVRAAGGNCPALTIMNNKHYRESGTNPGITNRLVNLDDVADTATFAEATWRRLTRIRNNVVDRDLTAKITLVNTTMTQEEEWADGNGVTLTGIQVNGLMSGTYTPTLTNLTNIDTSTAMLSQWIKIGDIVIVAGSLQVDATAAGAFTLNMTLPIASEIAATTDVGGSFGSGSADRGGRIEGVIAANEAIFRGNTSGASNSTYGFTFSYRILEF